MTFHKYKKIYIDLLYPFVVLFETRVFTYVADGWIFYPAALALVPGLEKTAREQLK
jgi:hypothetical protein